jgi:agmatine/peptidylarginine deiminase
MKMHSSRLSSLLLFACLGLGPACRHSGAASERVAVTARTIWGRTLFSAPPPEPLRPLAEWELQDAVALVYPGGVELDPVASTGEADEVPTEASLREQKPPDTAAQQEPGLSQLFWTVLPHAARHSRVLVVLDPQVWEQFLRGLRLRRLAHITDRIEIFASPNDSAWIRDYAPIFVEGQGSLPLAMDTLYCPDLIGNFASLMSCVRQTATHGRKQDDLFPYRLAQQLGLNWHRVPLVLEGGNFQSDSNGTCYTSRKTLVHNGESQPELDRQLQAYLGCRQVVYLEPIPGDTLSHIDMFFRVVADDLFLLADYRPIFHPTTTRGHFQEQIRKALDKSSEILQAQRPHARIVRIPMPDIVVDQGGETNFASPLNFLRLRGVVFVPHFSWSLDRQAMALMLLRQYLPKEEIIPVEADWLLRSFGAIHCLSANLPDVLPGGRVPAVAAAHTATAPARGPRVRFAVPSGAPHIGAKEAVVRIVYHGALSRDNALRFAQWARCAAAWPDEVSLTFVPRSAAGAWGHALSGALRQGKFWAGWDALLSPWPRNPSVASDDGKQLPQSIEETLAALYAQGVDALPIEQLIADGRAAPTAKALSMAGNTDQVYLDGLPLPTDLHADEILAVLRRELFAARSLLFAGTRRQEVPERLLDAVAPASAQPSMDLLLPGADNITTIHFFHDYQSPRSIAIARLLLRQRHPVRLRCVSYAHHPTAELACEAAYAAAAAGKLPVLHERLLAAGDELTEERIYGIASALGIDSAALAWSLSQHEHDGLLRRDLALLERLPGGEAPLLVLDNLAYGYNDQALLSAALAAKP